MFFLFYFNSSIVFLILFLKRKGEKNMKFERTELEHIRKILEKYDYSNGVRKMTTLFGWNRKVM